VIAVNPATLEAIHRYKRIRLSHYWKTFPCYWRKYQGNHVGCGTFWYLCFSFNQSKSYSAEGACDHQRWKLAKHWKQLQQGITKSHDEFNPTCRAIGIHEQHTLGHFNYRMTELSALGLSRVSAIRRFPLLRRISNCTITSDLLKDLRYYCVSKEWRIHLASFSRYFYPKPIRHHDKAIWCIYARLIRPTNYYSCAYQLLSTVRY